MKNTLAKGLAGILLAGLSLNGIAQKREYMQGNVHDVKYTLTTEKDFSKYKLEEQCLFDNCYAFWNYTPKTNELNFSVSNVEENANIFEIGKRTSIEVPKYIPTKIGNEINVTNLAITRTSYEKLRGKAKSKEYFGFSVDITDKDLKFKLPEINIKGIPHIVLKTVDNQRYAEGTLPLYLIPKIKGTKIIIPDKSFINGDYEIQARIICNENGGIYVPFLKIEGNLNTQEGNYPSEVPEIKQDTVKKTDYMKYREELEKQNSALEKKVTSSGKNNQDKSNLKKEDNQEYIIQSGDTFYNIADRFYGSGKRASDIEKLNPNIESTKLKIGQKILIPKR